MFISVSYSSSNMPSFLFETNKLNTERNTYEERVH